MACCHDHDELEEGCGCGDEACGCGEDSCGCGGGSCGCGGFKDQIAQYIVGPIETNCFAYISDGECMVVDPGASGDKIAAHLPEDVKVTTILATHGHGDHVGGVYALKEETGAKFYMHAADVEMAKRAGQAVDLSRAYDHDAPEPDETLEEGDRIKVGTAVFRVLETPGHTPGGICLLGEESARGILFVGDTLFKGSCGRTDLPGGSREQLEESLAKLCREVHPHTNIFCGHGDITSMEDEINSNPHLQML